MATHKKLSPFSQEYALTGANIDQISEILEERLQELGMERQNRIRIRFSMEESLLRMRDQFGESAVVRLSFWRKFSRPVLQIEQVGPRYNPLSKTEVDLEDWSGSLLTAVGLYPQYSYTKGRNILRLNLPVHRMNPALKILIAITAGMVLGVIFLTMLSVGQQTALSETLFQPLYDLWVRLLSALSGPVIFFMVVTTFLNTGGIEEEGGSSKWITIRYFAFSATAAVIALMVSLLISSNLTVTKHALWNGPAGFVEYIFGIVSEDPVSSIVQVNCPQILLVAILLGNGLVVIGSRAEQLIALVRQINMVGLQMTEWASRCVPYFMAALTCFEVMQRQWDMFLGLLQTLLLALVLSAVCMVVAMRYVAWQKDVPFSLLVRKTWPAFIADLKSGGLDEGFGTTEETCIRKLGIERHYAKISLPMGMTLYMPLNVICTLVFTIYAASKYNVAISVGWLAVAGALAVVMSVAAPPVPGASLLTYIALFNELGIPSVSLISAMIFDIMFGIFAVAGNQVLLQMDLILQADRIGLLNRDLLRKP